MRLIAEWLIAQRIVGGGDSVPAKKRKIAISRKTLMNRYQWQTRTTDTNTRTTRQPQDMTNRYIHTPNWERKERHQRKWGAGVNYNRNAGLVEGDWLILQQ